MTPDVKKPTLLPAVTRALGQFVAILFAGSLIVSLLPASSTNNGLLAAVFVILSVWVGIKGIGRFKRALCLPLLIVAAFSWEMYAGAVRTRDEVADLHAVEIGFFALMIAYLIWFLRDEGVIFSRTEG